MKEPIFQPGQKVRFAVDKQVYNVEHVTQTGGTPSERFYVLRLAAKFQWLSPFGAPAITHTLPEGYAAATLQKL